MTKRTDPPKGIETLLSRGRPIPGLMKVMQGLSVFGSWGFSKFGLQGARVRGLGFRVAV